MAEVSELVSSAADVSTSSAADASTSAGADEVNIVGKVLKYLKI